MDLNIRGVRGEVLVGLSLVTLPYKFEIIRCASQCMGECNYIFIQRVSEISTLILTSDRSRQEQNCFLCTIFSKYNFHSSTSCLFTHIF
jgi:hypothetical protein